MIYVIIFLILFYYSLTRGIPKILSWFIVARYQTEVRFGRLNLFRLSLEDVCVRKSPISIKVERIGVTSSLVNQEERKLFSIKFHDVRIEKEIDVQKSRTSFDSIGVMFAAAASSESSSEDIKPLEVKISPSVVSLAQFFGIHMINVSMMYLREKWPECLFHATAERIIFEGATLNQTNVAVSIKICSAHIKILQHAGESQNSPDNKGFGRGKNKPDYKLRPSCMLEQDPLLAECNISVKLFVEANAETVASMENFSLELNEPEVQIKEQLFIFMEQKVLAQTPVKGPSVASKKINHSDILHKYWLLVPLKSRFKVNKLNVKLVNSLGQSIIKKSVSSIDLQTHLTRDGALENLSKLLPDFSTELQVDLIKVESIHNSSIFLNRFNMQTQFVGDRINIKTEVRSLHSFYDHRDLPAWTHILKHYHNSSPPICRVKKAPEALKRNNWLGSYCLGMIIEIWDASIGIEVPKSSQVWIRLQHARHHLALTHGASQLAGELLLETLIASIGEENGSSNISNVSSSRRVHNWGTPGSLGMCLVQLSSSFGQSTMFPLQAEASLDNVQLEWSEQLSNFISASNKYLVEIKETIGNRKVRNYKTQESSGDILSSVSIKCSGINIFAHAEHSVMMRIDDLSAQKLPKYGKVCVTGTKCLKIKQRTTQYTCIKSTEIKDECLWISEVVVEHVNDEILMDLSENIILFWSPTIHMDFLTIFQNIQSFLSEIREQKPKHENISSEEPKLHLQLIARGNIQIGAYLSARHSVYFLMNDFTYLMANGRLSCQTDLLQMQFDDHKIMVVNDAKLSYALKSREIIDERESLINDKVELTQPHNKAWKLNVNTWKIIFPYEYNFAEAFSDDFLSVVKWVKSVHKKSPKEFTAESPLPPDIVIRVKLWVVEVCDDPFEVKLRYNYELLEDEYKESCVRKNTLEMKIEDLRKTRFLLSAEKMNELYKNLMEINCETYIKRSKQMYETPMRTQLFTWRMEDVVLFVLADPIFHGTEKVIQHMQEIDSDSPWPEEGIEFSTLWCRMVSASCTKWKFHLRDYPQSLLDMNELEIWGRFIGAEPKATKRAKRVVEINIDPPWGNAKVERTMTGLKFYHDLSCEVKTFTAAYGPCWEPAMSQFNLSLALINKPSLDPSKPLPWWDKIRLKYHGRLTFLVERMTLLLHASLDPYNTTEEMELTWTDLVMDWTNAKLIFKGDLNVYVRTASKYDDARLIHLPSLKLTIKLGWICRGNPNDHHSVMPCAPDQLPEYSSNQEHDSFRVFRSQNLNMNISLDTKSIRVDNKSVNPTIEVLFYGSTLKWFENLKFILSGVTRPTRRGKLFKNTKPRKPQLSRHYHTLHLSLSFQGFDVRYWMSVGVKKGFHLSGDRLSLSSEHKLSLVPPEDGLKHRPRSEWGIIYLHTEVSNAQIWLQNVMVDEKADESGSPEQADQISLAESQSNHSSGQTVEKFYFLNVSKVAYMRETLNPPTSLTPSSVPLHNLSDTPNHRLVVYDLKGAWTTNNRDIVFALYDSWNKNQQLKQNLRPDIIKNYTPETMQTPQKPRSRSDPSQGLTSPTSLQGGSVQGTPSPMSKLQSGHAQAMLQQLIAEADNNHVAFSEDCSNNEPRDTTLHGVKTSTTDDVLHKKWLIELVNSQVLLKGCETQGYVILSAAKSQIIQRIHRPTWQHHSLVTKTTWIGSLECMQYYATVSAGDKETQMENIMWLTVDNIGEKDSHTINEVTDIVGSGQSVGGVVSQTVGTTDISDDSMQLQRIVSRCRCEFYYVSYGETGLDPALLEEVHVPPPQDDLWNKNIEPVDTFTLMHHDLCASTNYLQYNMVVDILNNLLLYVDPKKKEESNSLARMRFQLQLSSIDDQKRPIVKTQNEVRYHLSQLRSLEKEAYLVQKQLDKDQGSMLLMEQKMVLERRITKQKEKISELSEELAMRIQCYNETQLSNKPKFTANGEKKVKIIRMNEVCFRKAQWRLTEADGQLGIADLVLSNFLYTKKSFLDDCGEHLLELGYVTMRNLLPNQVYSEALMPSELQMNMPVDRQRTLRIYCKEKPPCGGISIIEHFEVNVVPLNIALTYQFFKTMFKFCFPYTNSSDDDVQDEMGSSRNLSKVSKQQTALKKSQKVSNFYVKLQKDDVEIMKQRAEQNKLFVYIKIPEVPIKFSYKGKKDKNVEDVSNFRLVVPTLEYHNVTWTWLDFLMAIKQESKSALVSQAIKQRLNLSKFRDDEKAPSEDEKKKLLLGKKPTNTDQKGGKKKFLQKIIK